MKPVGIIANPASGRDIRRLISSATATPIQEKIQTLVRMVRSLDAMCVERVVFMPDPTGIAQKVAQELQGELSVTTVEALPTPYLAGNATDSSRAAATMRDMDCALIIVLGGDGTSRVVSKDCGYIPILPVSSGTNNVFPQFVEGTLLGLAAGALAREQVSTDQCCEHVPMLELHDEAGIVEDTALVDLAVIASEDIGTRAVWEPERILELFLAMARPSQIGLSSIGGWYRPQSGTDRNGMYLMLGEDGERVSAPIAPGLIASVGVKRCLALADGESRKLSHDTGVVALDGEREIVLEPGSPRWVRYRLQGPRVVNLEKTLEFAARSGVLSNGQHRS